PACAHQGAQLRGHVRETGGQVIGDGAHGAGRPGRGDRHAHRIDAVARGQRRTRGGAAPALDTARAGRRVVALVRPAGAHQGVDEEKLSVVSVMLPFSARILPCWKVASWTPYSLVMSSVGKPNSSRPRSSSKAWATSPLMKCASVSGLQKILPPSKSR